MNVMNTTQDMARGYVTQTLPLSLLYHAGKWWQYHPTDGWREAETAHVEGHLTKYLWEFNSERNAISVTKPMINDVLHCVRSVLMMPSVSGNQLDESVFVNFNDGDVTTESAEGYVTTHSHHIHVPRVATALARGEAIPEDAMRAADSSLFTWGMIPCEFDPEATCPRWEQFVREACPNDAGMLQKMFGLSLTFDRRYNVFFIIHGAAGTGKSTALKILASLNKGTTCSVSLSEFDKTFNPYDLTVNRLNLLSDMGAVSAIDSGVGDREGLLKTCTAGEMKNVQLKYVNPMTRALRSLLVFGCNTLPHFADRSRAISDRMRIISFPNIFRATATEDNKLAEKLQAELPGILIWALKGYGELLNSGVAVFPETLESQRLKTDSINASHPERLFCDDLLVLTGNPDDQLPTMRVYDEYCTYCKRRGYRAGTSKAVILEIAEYMQLEKLRKSIAGEQLSRFFGVRFRAEVSLINHM